MKVVKEREILNRAVAQNFKVKGKNKTKIPDLHLNASSDQWKTLTQKRETLQVGSAQEPFPHADKAALTLTIPSPFWLQHYSWTAKEPCEKQEGRETMDVTLQSYL